MTISLAKTFSNRQLYPRPALALSWCATCSTLHRMFVSHLRGQDARPRRRAVWALLALLTFGLATPALAKGSKLDTDLQHRAKGDAQGLTSVIVTLSPRTHLPPQLKKFARLRGALNIINGHVLDLPVGVLRQLDAFPEIARAHYNRPISGTNYRTSIGTGSRAVHSGYGLTGAGIGVAVLDSGIASWHNDLTNHTAAAYPYGDQRVAAFVDFVNGRMLPYDDEGHGTHVAGIIAGNGYDSVGQQVGGAPDATLVALKVLDAHGQGTISNVIAALDWVLAHHNEYHVRVVNLSAGAPVRESYWTDPLTLAAKRVVDAGVIVVTAAGNHGRNALGEPLYGGITAPGNAPWVLTVGASSTNGTPTRADDVVAGFSSRGPTYLDWSAKPDLVAPGHGTVSLADPASALYSTKSQFLIAGAVGGTPYLVLSGTSMAAPVVSGAVALMLQANPALTPNAVKAILQYTAQEYVDYNPLTQGAGFLNTLGAVRLARFFATAQPGETYPLQQMWSKKIIWGSHRLSGGVLDPSANAYAITTTWSVAKTDGNDNIIWGTTCQGGCDPGDHIVWRTDGDDDNIIWGTSFLGDNIIWGTALEADNIIWGTECGGGDCDNIIWGTDDDDNIIWGTDGDGDNIIWGTELAADNIIWGTDDDDNIIWGTLLDTQDFWTAPLVGDAIVFDWAMPLDTVSDEQIFDVLSDSATTEPVTPDGVVAVDPQSTPLPSSTASTSGPPPTAIVLTTVGGI
jgi:serine protease AprX